jgi:CRISPR-associated endonuclease Csn1
MPKKASRKVEFKGHGKVVAKGDSARSSLHNDTYYGAIERDGEIRYVVRRALSSFEKISEIENIVDEVVREKVRKAIEGKEFKKAIAEPIYMNKEKGILINKVRCFVPSVKFPLNIRHHRDQSTKEYKQQYHVANDSNYCMAIYEGEIKGKKKRGFKIVNMLEASAHFKQSNENRCTNIVETQNPANLPWKQTIRIGTNVLLYESSATELFEANGKELSRRLYKVIGLSSMVATGNLYGRIYLKHSIDSRASKDIKSKNGEYIQGEEFRPAITMLHTQFNALIEGQDFELTPLGDIKFKK